MMQLPVCLSISLISRICCDDLPSATSFAVGKSLLTPIPALLPSAPTALHAGFDAMPWPDPMGAVDANGVPLLVFDRLRPDAEESDVGKTGLAHGELVEADEGGLWGWRRFTGDCREGGG